MVDKLLSRAGLVGLGALAFIPVFVPYMPYVEGHILPVTKSVVLSGETRTEDGVQFLVRFSKKRQCDFKALVWYRGDTKLLLDFEPEADVDFPTRLTGDQATGPWELKNVTELVGTRSVAVHRCHWLWDTYTEFYP